MLTRQRVLYLQITIIAITVRLSLMLDGQFEILALNGASRRRNVSALILARITLSWSAVGNLNAEKDQARPHVEIVYDYKGTTSEESGYELSGLKG